MIFPLNLIGKRKPYCSKFARTEHMLESFLTITLKTLQVLFGMRLWGTGILHKNKIPLFCHPTDNCSLSGIMIFEIELHVQLI